MISPEPSGISNPGKTPGAVTIALAIGHEPAKAGAVGEVKDREGKLVKVSEYAFNVIVSGKVRAMLAAEPAVHVLDFRRHLVGGYSKLPKAINAAGAEFAVELHFNAADNAAASGCEMLYWHTSQRSKVFAGVLQTRVRLALGNRDRALKPIDATGRGAPFLRGTNCPAVIAEPFFGSNTADMRNAMDKIDDLAAAYADGILEIARMIKEGAHQ